MYLHNIMYVSMFYSKISAIAWGLMGSEANIIIFNIDMCRGTVRQTMQGVDDMDEHIGYGMGREYCGTMSLILVEGVVLITELEVTYILGALDLGPLTMIITCNCEFMNHSLLEKKKSG